MKGAVSLFDSSILTFKVSSIETGNPAVKERALKLYKLKDIELNPDRYKQSEITKAKTNIQNVYKTRSRENKEYELKKIEEAERMKETRQKLRVRK